MVISSQTNKICITNSLANGGATTDGKSNGEKNEKWPSHLINAYYMLILHNLMEGVIIPILQRAVLERLAHEGT